MKLDNHHSIPETFYITCYMVHPLPPWNVYISCCLSKKSVGQTKDTEPITFDRSDLLPVCPVNISCCWSKILWSRHGKLFLPMSKKKVLFRLSLTVEGGRLHRLWLKFGLAGLELKLHEVHFAVKFSEAEAQPRLRRTWLQSARSAVATQCQQCQQMPSNRAK